VRACVRGITQNLFVCTLKHHKIRKAVFN